MRKPKSPSYKSSRGKGRKSGGVTFAPKIVGVIVPATERESLEAKIEKERAFILKYPNYPADCERAAARITFYQKRLIEIDLQAESEKESAEFINAILSSITVNKDVSHAS